MLQLHTVTSSISGTTIENWNAPQWQHPWYVLDILGLFYFQAIGANLFGICCNGQCRNLARHLSEYIIYHFRCTSCLRVIACAVLPLSPHPCPIQSGKWFASSETRGNLCATSSDVKTLKCIKTSRLIRLFQGTLISDQWSSLFCLICFVT